MPTKLLIPVPHTYTVENKILVTSMDASVKRRLCGKRTRSQQSKNEQLLQNIAKNLGTRNAYPRWTKRIENYEHIQHDVQNLNIKHKIN